MLAPAGGFRRALALALLLLSSTSCDPSDSPEGGARGGPPDVLLISVDCMRADRVGAYGYGRDTTPAIDDVAADGIRFERAYAQSNWTKPSVASLLSGLYVRNHGVVVGSDHFDEAGRHKVKDKSFPLPEDIPTLGEAFQDLGHRTAGFIENSHLVAAQGFARGFDEYEKAKPAADALLAWLEDLDADDRFFAYLHVIGPHDPYDGGLGRRFREEYRNRFGEYDSAIDWTDLAYKKLRRPSDFTEQDLLQVNALYDAELHYFDQEQIAPVIAWLRASGRYDEALVVITSDHGEELFDHGRWSHGETLYEEVIRIPLIVKLPASLTGLPAGSSVGEVTEQIGLFPTLCELAGCELVADVDGRSFASLLLGRRGEDPEAYAVSEFGKGVRTQVLGAAIVQGDRKWVESYPSSVGPMLLGPIRSRRDMTPRPYLMDAFSDEILDQPERGAPHPMRSLLEQAIGLDPAIRHALVDGVGYTEAELEELRALGYLE